MLVRRYKLPSRRAAILPADFAQMRWTVYLATTFLWCSIVAPTSATDAAQKTPNLGLLWREVHFKIMPLNASHAAKDAEVKDLQTVPHVWSKQLSDDFLPVCDPTSTVAHLICREAGFDTYTTLDEVDGSSYDSDDFVRMSCSPFSTNIADCLLYKSHSCSRVAEISCGACGGDVFLEEGKPVVITSPGFPNRLLPLTTCYWKFISPSDEDPIAVEFDDFDLPEDCRAGWITVGSLLRTGQLLLKGEKHCGKDKPEEFESDSTIAILRYNSWLGIKSPGNVNHRGFRAVVRMKEEASVDQAFSGSSATKLLPKSLIRDDVHLGVALGFTFVVLLVFTVIAAVYYRRIAKLKRRHETHAKNWTHQTMEGQSEPDHVYQSMKGRQPSVLSRPSQRRPLQTIYVDENNGKPALPPPRSPTGPVAPARPMSTLSVAGLLPTDEVDSEYVIVDPNVALLRSYRPQSPPPQSRFIQKLKCLFGIRPTQPISDGLLTRNITIRRRDRAVSFPVLYDAGKLLDPEPMYMDVKSSGNDSKKATVPNDYVESRFRESLKQKQAGKVARIPEINLEECDETCTFVRKL